MMAEAGGKSVADGVAVLDIGKSNVKLSACLSDGRILETLSTPNTVLPGPPWDHHDLGGLNEWLLSGLAELARRHELKHFITSGHGSGGVLTHADPDEGGDGAALPMIDYEQTPPAWLDEAYLPLAGSFEDRGSAVMQASTHTARQMLWAEMAEPEAFSAARWCLAPPQYWAWRLSGVAAGEASLLGAQSHLYNTPQKREAPIVGARGWGRLMPPIRHAGAALGPLRPELAKRYGLPADMQIHTGGHDSTLNFYRYQAAGERNFCVVSTGTWIVAMADQLDLSRLDERKGMTCNADIAGAPLGGALTMGGREYAAVAGAQEAGGKAGAEALQYIIDREIFALPSFGPGDGQFPGSAGAGRISEEGGLAPQHRLALAALYVALLTVECADALAPGRRLILDGSFLNDPAFARLVAALRPGVETVISHESYGVAAGAALLCAPEGAAPAAPPPERPREIRLTGLTQYARRWRELAQQRIRT